MQLAVMLCPLPSRHSQAGALAQVAAFASGACLKEGGLLTGVPTMFCYELNVGFTVCPGHRFRWWLWMLFATSCDGVLGSGF